MARFANYPNLPILWRHSAEIFSSKSSVMADHELAETTANVTARNLDFF